MKLNIRAAAVAGALFWGGCFLLTGIANLVWPGYGAGLLLLGASVYPGYLGPTGGFGSVAVVTLYALVDGAVAGAVLAWLYNVSAGMGKSPGATR